jgi:hypothetical protein
LGNNGKGMLEEWTIGMMEYWNKGIRLDSGRGDDLKRVDGTGEFL